MAEAGNRPRVVFFGNERLATGVTTACPTLKRLVAAGYNVVAIVANYERSQSRKVRELEIQQAASELGIPILVPDKPADIIEQLRAYHADVGVLVAYGKIVPQSVIDIFPHGIINIHPSLLPLHRGPTPLENVILDGSTSTAVSIMQLVKAMDAGPVYAQQTVELHYPHKQALADQLLDIGSDMIIRHLSAILEDNLQPTQQNDDQATYDRLIQKQDGLIDSAKSATQLEREVRAYAGWPGSRMAIAGKDAIIIDSHIADYELTALKSVNYSQGDTFQSPEGNIGLVCNPGILIIDKLKPAGKPEMPAKAFLAGNKL